MALGTRTYSLKTHAFRDFNTKLKLLYFILIIKSFPNNTVSHKPLKKKKRT